MGLMGDLVGIKKNKLVLRPHGMFVCPDTMLGLEFEFEGVTRVDPELRGSSYWEDKEDGSLHNAGREFVFRQPMFGEDVTAALDQLMKYAVTYKYKPSRRTGIHVHMDVRDLTNFQLAGLIGYYCLFETALYGWIGNDRDSNNFCLPYFKAHGSLDQAVALLSSTFQQRDNVLNAATIALSRGFHRYPGLNLKCVAELGSIEFRQLETTLDIGRVYDWINLILCLKRAALQVPESSTHGVLADVWREGPVLLASKIFGDLSKSLISQPNFLSGVLEVGYPQAYYFLDSLDRARHPPIEETLGEWDVPTGLKDSETHIGYQKWVKATFPKDELDCMEKPPDPDENVNRLVRTDDRGCSVIPPEEVTIGLNLVVTGADGRIENIIVRTAPGDPDSMNPELLRATTGIWYACHLTTFTWSYA